MTTWATWGKFAADILSYNWLDALEELKTLKDTIDQRVSSIYTYLVIYDFCFLIIGFC